MSNSYTYREVLHEINVSGAYWWQNMVARHRTIAKIMTMFMVFWTLLIIYLTIFDFLNIIIGFFAIIGGGLLTYAIVLYENENSFLIFFIGMTFTGLAETTIGIVVVLMYTYIIYKLLLVRQIKKAEKFASMTPKEIAKMKDKPVPRMEITFRGGER